MAQEMKPQTDVQTDKEALVGKIITNYSKVVRVYNRILEDSKKHKYTKTELYDRIMRELNWDPNKRPMVRQLVNRYLKEISDDKKKE